MTISSKKNLYFQRKKRTNDSMKKLLPLYRCLVIKSNKHIRAQVIDINGNIVVSFCDTNKDLNQLKINKTQSSVIVWEGVGKKLLDMWIVTCVFDRNGYMYHGRVKALCDAIRGTWVKI